MKQESSPLKNLVVPAVVLPFLAPMAAFAAEGTGRVSHYLILHNILLHVKSSKQTNKLLP